MKKNPNGGNWNSETIQANTKQSNKPIASGFEPRRGLDRRRPMQFPR
jgi:hypothetical protein